MFALKLKVLTSGICWWDGGCHKVWAINDYFLVGFVSKRLISPEISCIIITLKLELMRYSFLRLPTHNTPLCPTPFRTHNLL